MPVEVIACGYHPTKPAKNVVSLRGRGNLPVCKPCEVLVKAKNKKVVCQYCNTPITGNWRNDPLPGFEHGPECPRNLELEVVVIDPPGQDARSII